MRLYAARPAEQFLRQFLKYYVFAEQMMIMKANAFESIEESIENSPSG